MKTVIIVGSSRKDGETQKIVNKLFELENWDIINLSDYNFSYFDYQHANKNDDYITLLNTIIEKYDVLVFATPVYWYAMSGIMKVFFDRITDLLTIEKELGRKLVNKKMAVITTSSGNNLGDMFWLPFSKTASYLHMNFIGGLHTICNQDNTIVITDFASKIRSSD